MTLGVGCEVASAADPVYGVSASSSLKARDYSEMEKGGVQALRVEISWGETQGKGGALDWSRTDRLIQEAAEHGLEVVPYLTGLPNWAKSCHKGHCQVPVDPETDGWLRFVKEAVERYGAGGSFWPVGSGQVTLPVTAWQVWNIANKTVPPRTYGTLLEATYQVIKLADPDASVLTGGLSYAGSKQLTDPSKYLRALLRSNGKDSLSAVAVAPQSRSVRRVKSQVKEVRHVLNAMGHKSNGIWVTPIGWSSDRSKSGMSVGKTGQKSRLQQSMKMFRRGFGVEGVFWSRWRDGGGGCKWCRRSGLVAGSGKAKPAWKAYKKFLGTLGPGGPHGGDPGPFFFGVSPEDGQFGDTDLDVMEKVGVGSVRFVVAQQDIESSGGSFDWGRTDDLFERLALHGIRPLPLLFGDTREVVRVNDPASMQSWRRFAGAAVSRYEPGSPFWQQFAADHPGVAPQPPNVWQLYNEQNTLLYWPPHPSPTAFAKFLHVSAEAIRGADPSAKIMLGGMYADDSMNGMLSWEFLKQLYDVPGARADFDIVAIHPYSFSLDVLSWQVENIRQVMVDANDASTPVWITEIGWGSEFDDDPSKQSWWERDEQGQADMLTSSWNLLLQKRKAWNIGGIYWYTWRDPGFRSCEFCESAGLFKNNFVAKPAATAFKELAESAGAG